MASQHFDVIIIGAGLSGIGTACHIANECPEKSLAIIERRDTMGGTWDLFRYPGIRSDSDMVSFGFRFKPWFSDKVLARGDDIQKYVVETAKEFQIKDKVHFGVKVTELEWCSTEQLWKITALKGPAQTLIHYTCSFIANCSGFYNYDHGYRPSFPNEQAFGGDIVHPQKWPENLETRGKKVVVIGSGATAVTLVPALAKDAEHVTMLQRSPTYIMALPDTDKMSLFMNKLMPKSWVFHFARKRNILFQRALYLTSLRWPNFMRKFMLRHVKKQLAPHVDMKHFTPSYNPWEQRLCAAPDGDFFDAINSGQATVATDQIECFTESGIQLKSGEALEADIIVSATGLNIQWFGGAKLKVDDVEVNLAEKMAYKSIMLQDIPNFTWVFGYTNAPWTLKCDIAGQYLCRLLKHMDEHQLKVATPVDLHNSASEDRMLQELSSGYLKRSMAIMPKQGKKEPWRVLMHFGKDKKILTEDPIDDGILAFAKEAALPTTKQKAA
jgi:cation diffusion facilitator CzcD-associated flavoprotein CzcO